jgi:hypothetical protein
MTADGAMLARIERRAIWIALAMAVAALVVPSGGPALAAGVFGGAGLAAVSYWAIRRGVNELVAAMQGGASSRARSAQALIMLVGRYALLALIAYVMIARLRLSPLGLLLGASVIPAAATIEAIATLRKNGKV